VNSMLHMPIILAARSHDEDWIKILFGVMAFLIWVGGAIVSAIKKRAEENRRVQRYGQMPAGVTPTAAPPMLPPPVPQRMPQTAGRAKSGRTMAKRVQAPPAARVTAGVVAATLNRAAMAAPATVLAAAAPVQRAAPLSPAPANQIGRLLRRADSLRAALILNEVLSPPLSLREDRGIPDEPALH
jgi:hypothetical protein